MLYVLYFVSVCVKPLKAFLIEEVILKFYYRFYLFYCYKGQSLNRVTIAFTEKHEIIL